MILTKSFKFEAAHKLDDYEGPCKHLHGHSYRLEVSIIGEVNSNGMIIDFHEFDKIISRLIIGKLDHSYLNKIIKLPTAENILAWIELRLENELKLSIYEIRLWETENCSVSTKKMI